MPDASLVRGPVAVVGLGLMGSAIAGRLLEAGVETHVWNRTPSRAEPLLAAGAPVDRASCNSFGHTAFPLLRRRASESRRERSRDVWSHKETQNASALQEEQAAAGTQARSAHAAAGTHPMVDGRGARRKGRR